MDEESCIKKTHIFEKHLYSIPELAWKEEKTISYIIEQLGDNYVWREKTAVVYKIGEGIPIFFRAEIDALNTIEGPKHVCGHSAHTASLMSAYLFLLRNLTPGYQIFFIFQPSEEAYPSGAAYIYDHYKPLRHCRFGIAFHSFPSRTVGEIMNPYMASGDYFEITVTGKGTHIKNKYTNKGNDAIILAAKICTTINESHFPKSIINVGTCTAGETANSIAGKALITGDIRALTESARTDAYQFLKNLVEKVNTASKMKTKLFYSKYYPILHNDKTLLRSFKKIIPVNRTIVSYATEDFSLYAINKLFFFIGTGQSTDLHETNFRTTKKLSSALTKHWITIIHNLALLVQD